MVNRRFPDKAFSGQSLSRKDVSRTICMNTFEYYRVHVHVAINVHVARYGSLFMPRHKVFSIILHLRFITAHRSKLYADVAYNLFPLGLLIATLSFTLN